MNGFDDDDKGREGQAPQPPVPPDCDLTDFDYMPLDVARLRRSKQWLVAKRKPEVGFYALNLWLASWHEKPAASLEDDDDVLADAAMCPPARWKVVKADVMRGWTRCSDGRLYHVVVAEKALSAWIEKLGQRKSSEAGNAKRYKRTFDPVAYDAAILRAVAMLAKLDPHARIISRYRAQLAAAESDGAPEEAPDDPPKRSRRSPVGSTIGSPVGNGSGSQVKGRDIYTQKDKPSVCSPVPGAGTHSASGGDDPVSGISPDWHPGEAEYAIGRELGLTPALVDAAGRMHVEYWLARPDARRTPQAWALQFLERLRDVANDPKQRKRVEARMAKSAPKPAPVEGPPWWRETGARIAAAHPGHFRSYWATCEALDDGRTLVCRGGRTALEWLQDEGMRQARGLGLTLAVVAPAPSKIPAGIAIAGAA